LVTACGSTRTTDVYASGMTHVAAMTFDARGGLWVATAAYQDTGDDAVYLVTSRGAPAVKVISGLHTALGLLWIGDALYVASKERVDRYTGLAGTRFAQHTNVLTLPRGVGEVNNLVRAPDGRLLLGISAPCDHCTPTSKYSASIMSFRPDGSDLRVYAGEIRAPVGLTYGPGSNDLYVTMNQRDDLGAATPGDTLAVVAEGSTWGFPDHMANAPSPVAVLDKHAAVTGVAIVGGAAYVAEWAKGKVMRIALSTRKVDALAITNLKSPTAVVALDPHTLLVGDWATGTIWRVPL
jgi:glucose/arabinose dehydrogenase